MAQTNKTDNLYPVSNLAIRYSITNTAIYQRRNHLEIGTIKISKNTFITETDLKRLDKLHEFILRGNKLKDYVEESPATVHVETTQESSTTPQKPEPVDLPLLEPPADKEKKEWSEPKIWFQAVGVIKGEVSYEQFDKKKFRFFVEIAGNKFRLHIPELSKRLGLKKNLESNSYLYFRVYPKTNINPLSKEVELYFQVVAWNNRPMTNAQGNIEEAGIFILRGVWQFTPQFRAPILTVYRNKNKAAAKDPLNKYKASHLPILMRRDDCTPFRFNPKADKDLIPPRYFINALFKFIPHKNAFGWQSDIQPPTTELPRYKKPVKFDSAAVTGEKKKVEFEHGGKQEQPKPKQIKKLAPVAKPETEL